MDAHPSLDASDAFKKQEVAPSGADIVSKELDEFNERYRYLMDVLYGRLQEIARMNPNDIVTLVSTFLILDGDGTDLFLTRLDKLNFF